MCNFRDKLCVKNVALLQEIEKIHPVRFEKWDQQNWGAKFSIKENVGIVFHPTIFSDAKAAHELLHLKMNIIMGDNRILLEEALKYPPHLPKLFQFEVVQHFLNSYEHKKMFEEYLSMGFDANDFFEKAEQSDFFQNFVDKIWKEGLTDRSNNYHTDTLGQYICCIISYISYPLDSRWKKELKRLDRADKTLYKIILDYWNKILGISLNNAGKAIINKEHINFIAVMKKWTDSKKII